MAIETYTEQLERVQTGIKSLEESLVQSSTHGDRTLVRQRLEVLYEREKYLRVQVKEETVSGAGDIDGPIRVRGMTPYV